MPHMRGQLPIIPAHVLTQHHVRERCDTRFRSCARLLQALWREAQDLPLGWHAPPRGRKRRLGSLLAGPTAAIGRNFLSPAVAQVAARAVAYQEPGALIDRRRLFTNLLSSMPLAFNAFAPLALDPGLAGRVARTLLPGHDIARVTHVWFEHSPGRRDVALSGDRSAFDVAIFYARSDARPGALYIEVKYSEDLGEQGPHGLGCRYDDLAHASGLFHAPAHAALRVNPLQQLFREHLLAQAAVMRGDVAEATFLLCAPDANDRVQRSAALYAAHLVPTVPGQVPFVNITLERLVEALAWAGARDEAAALFDRYLDWRKVDQAVAAALDRTPMTWRVRLPASPVALLEQAA